MQCEYYALEGLSDLVNTIKKVRAHFNPAIEIEGLLRTMFDPAQHAGATGRQTSSRAISATRCYDTIMPRNVRLAEAPSYGLPAIKFDATCKGSQAYVALAEEILWRTEARAAAQRAEVPAA